MVLLNFLVDLFQRRKLLLLIIFIPFVAVATVIPDDLFVEGANGINFSPGSDTNVDLVTVDVTGAPKLSWDETNDLFQLSKPLGVGDGLATGTHTVSGSPIGSGLELHSEGGTDLGGLTVHRHTDSNALGGHVLTMRSRGTHASPTVLAINDIVSRFVTVGYDGTDYEWLAEIQVAVDGTPGNNDMPGRISFLTTSDGSATPSEAMRIDSNQEVTIGPATADASLILDIASTTRGAKPAPTMSQTQRDAIISPKAGSLIYNNDFNQYNYYNGATWGEIGGAGSSGGVNIFSDFEADDITQVSTYDDAAATPVDLAGGTVDYLTVTSETSAPIHGDASYLLTKSANDARGEGYVITSDALKGVSTGGGATFAQFWYQTSANYVSGDLLVYAYRTGSNTLESLQYGTSNSLTACPSPNYCPYIGVISATSSDTDLKLGLHTATTNANAYTVKFDLLSAGPNAKVQSAIVTESELFTPVVNNIPGTKTGVRSRVGDSLDMTVNVAVTGVATGVIGIELPPGLTADTTKLTDATQLVGIAEMYDANTNTGYVGWAYLASSTLINIYGPSTSGQWQATTPATWASGDELTIKIKVPITNWNSGNAMSQAELSVRSAKVRVTKSGTQALTGGTTTKLTGFTVVKDINNVWDATNNRINIASAGWHNIGLQVQSTPGTTASQALAYRINAGGWKYVGEFIQSAHNGDRFGGNSTDYLNAGDYVEFGVFTSASATVQTGDGNTWVTIEALPDLTVVGLNGVNELKYSLATTDTTWTASAYNWGDITSLSLTPGTWDCDAQLSLLSTALTTAGSFFTGIGTVSGTTAPGGNVHGPDFVGTDKTTRAYSTDSVFFTKKGIIVTAPTTYYMKGSKNDTISDISYSYAFYCRRIQ